VIANQPEPLSTQFDAMIAPRARSSPLTTRARISDSTGLLRTNPIHLHRHSFELISLASKPIAGVLKDVMMLGGYQEAEVDFVANNPRLTLFTAISNCTWISDL
jgi:hypothetical protein